VVQLFFSGDSVADRIVVGCDPLCCYNPQGRWLRPQHKLFDVIHGYGVFEDVCRDSKLLLFAATRSLIQS
jgi:hypothetical protein